MSLVYDVTSYAMSATRLFSWYIPFNQPADWWLGLGSAADTHFPCRGLTTLLMTEFSFLLAVVQNVLSATPVPWGG